MRVGIYVRVSTQRQAQAQTIEQQLERLQSHAQQQGWMVESAHLFRDDGYSGAKLKRPGLDGLRDCVAARELDLVLVTAPDRLARHYVHQVIVLEEIEATGCRVQFLERPMSQDPHDQLLLQVRGAVAEYERTLISERMRRGRMAKLKAGLLLPWVRVPFGYRVDPDHPRDPAGVRVEESEAAALREMFAWYADEHSSLYRLARKLVTDGVPAPRGHWRWNVATLREILANPCYTGQVYIGRVKRRREADASGASKSRQPVPREDWMAVASVPAIVSQELFDRVQVKLRQNQQFAKRHNTVHDYLLRALVSCGTCGLACTARSLPGGYGYYVCRGKAPAVQSCRDQKCPARFVPAHQVDALVWTDLCALLTEPEQLAHGLARAHAGNWLPQELQARREGLRKGQASLEQQLERLTKAYLDGIVGLEEFGRRRSEGEQRRQALLRQQAQLEAQVDRQTEVAHLALSLEDFCRRTREGLAQASFEQKRHLMELLVDRVVVTEGEVEIRYVMPTTPESERVRFCQLHSDHRGVSQSSENGMRHGAATTAECARAAGVVGISGDCSGTAAAVAPRSAHPPGDTR